MQKIRTGVFCMQVRVRLGLKFLEMLTMAPGKDDVFGDDPDDYLAQGFFKKEFLIIALISKPYWTCCAWTDCVDILLPSITKLVNLSLADVVFPQKFKEAVVTPLIKKASLPNEDLQNYRPVSGPCFMSKLVERVVVKQLMQHINSNNLDNPRQSAYKSGHSNETALLHIKNEIHLSLSWGKPTALVLLDLSAAFDTIDHTTLLNCLESWFGVCGTRPISATVSKQLKLGQPSLNYMSCCSECHKAQFLVLCCSPYTPLL